MRKNIYAILIAALVSAFGLTLTFPTKSLAEIGGFSTPFGGRINARIPCTCAAGSLSLLIVGSPAGGQFILSPASRVYRNNAVFPPNWTLGLADGFAPCLVGVPPFCANAGQGPIIRIMGTS